MFFADLIDTMTLSKFLKVLHDKNESETSLVHPAWDSQGAWKTGSLWGMFTHANFNCDFSSCCILLKTLNTVHLFTLLSSLNAILPKKKIANKKQSVLGLLTQFCYKIEVR